MTKPDILIRMVDIVARLRAVSAFLPQMNATSADTARILSKVEDDLTDIETTVSIVIDNLMATRYLKHNAASHIAFDVNGLSGRWRTQRTGTYGG